MNTKGAQYGKTAEARSTAVCMVRLRPNYTDQFQFLKS